MRFHKIQGMSIREEEKNNRTKMTDKNKNIISLKILLLEIDSTQYFFQSEKTLVETE